MQFYLIIINFDFVWQKVTVTDFYFFFQRKGVAKCYYLKIDILAKSKRFTKEEGGQNQNLFKHLKS
jgi:hypothetical protein